MNKGKLLYQTEPDRGFVFRTWDLPDSKGEALIEIERDVKIIRSFNFPGYKIWNIYAHSDDIIQSELEKDVDGYLIAGSDGLGGNVFSTTKKSI